MQCPSSPFCSVCPPPQSDGGRGAAQPRLGQAGPGGGGGCPGLPAERGCRWGVSLPARWVQPPPAPGGGKLGNKRGAAGAGLGRAPPAALPAEGLCLPLKAGGSRPVLGQGHAAAGERSGAGFPLGGVGGGGRGCCTLHSPKLAVPHGVCGAGSSPLRGTFPFALLGTAFATLCTPPWGRAAGRGG